MRTSPVHPTSRCCAVVAAFVALLCAAPHAGAASRLISALGWSEPPFAPLSEEEAHHALERDLLLKVGKHLQASDYPDEARRWRWTGTVLVEVLVAANGMVMQVALSRSSGFRVLDMQALEVVRRVPKVFVPVGLRQRDRTVTVPVGFYLQKS